MGKFSVFKFRKDWLEGLDNCLKDGLLSKDEYYLAIESILRYGTDSDYKLDGLPMMVKYALSIPRYQIDRCRSKKYQLKEQREKDLVNSIRNSDNYKVWRKMVFERDNYTCQSCLRKGGKLEAHHLRPFSKFESDRMEISNGITLCKSCHKKWHKKYGINPVEIFLL